MKKLVIALATLLAVCLAYMLISTGLDLYRRGRTKIVETLEHPVYIKKIEATFLLSTSDSKIYLPEIKHIPKLPNVIQRDLYKYGLERTSSGSYFGLFRIHHWCGNDYVGYHLARIDLSSLFAAIDAGMVNSTPIGIDAGSYNNTQMPVEFIMRIKTEQDAAANP